MDFKAVDPFEVIQRKPHGSQARWLPSPPVENCWLTCRNCTKDPYADLPGIGFNVRGPARKGLVPDSSDLTVRSSLPTSQGNAGDCVTIQNGTLSQI